MVIPKEIAKKVAEYEKHKTKAKALFGELEKWFSNNHNADAIYCEFSIEKKLESNVQCVKDGEEYCDQTIFGEDSYFGNYYVSIEGNTQYICYCYSLVK